MTDTLHAELESLEIGTWTREAVVHALIDLGVVTKLECMHPHCILPDRKFQPSKSGRERAALQIDHILQRVNDGNHRPENLRIVHASCNMLSSAYQPRDRGREGIYALHERLPVGTRVRVPQTSYIKSHFPWVYDNATGIISGDPFTVARDKYVQHVKFDDDRIRSRAPGGLTLPVGLLQRV